MGGSAEWQRSGETQHGRNVSFTLSILRRLLVYAAATGIQLMGSRAKVGRPSMRLWPGMELSGSVRPAPALGPPAWGGGHPISWPTGLASGMSRAALATWPPGLEASIEVTEVPQAMRCRACGVGS